MQLFIYVRQPGQGVAEYGLPLTLVSVAAVAIMGAIGGQANTLYQAAANVFVAERLH